MDAGPEISWSDGGRAVVIGLRGVQMRVHSTRPFAPGKPVVGTLSGDTPRSLLFKVATARSVGDSTWEIHGRLVTATRELLADLEALLAKTTETA